MSRATFYPALIGSIKEIKQNPRLLIDDLLAGVIVGIVALPLSIAFAIASGVDPQRGLVTAVIAGFAIAAFSGSKFQIGGPTGAFIVIVYGIVQKFGYDGLAVATVMAGLLLMTMGFLKLGDVIKFIPYPVTVGFTAGIAVIIFTTQVKEFFGFAGPMPEHFHQKILYYFTHINQVQLAATIIGASSIAIILLWSKVSAKIPAPLVAILATTIVVKIFDVPCETIFDRFGKITCSLGKPALPMITIDKLTMLFPSAVTIAILAGVESLLSAVVADGMTGTKHKSNTELIGQGIANVFSPLFGGIPATGAIARTATNIKNGGKTSFAGIIHSITILIIFLFMGRYAELIPMATLSGILIIVAYNMGEWDLFTKILKTTKSDFFVLVTTFLLTIFVDLTVAIEAGMVMAAFLFMKQMIDITELGYITRSMNGNKDAELHQHANLIPNGVEVFEIEGPFFFGAAMRFRDTIAQVEKTPKVLILRMRHVPTIDATGLNALEEIIKKTTKQGTAILLCGVRPGLMKILKNAELKGIVADEMILHSFELALKKAREILESKKQPEVKN